MKSKFRHFFRCSVWLSTLLCLATLGYAQSIPTLNAQQLAFLSLINNFRAQNGAGPLQVSVALQNSSQWMSNDMATKNYFSHTDSLGRDPYTRMASFGYPYLPAGENIAAGFADAQSVFNGFETACDPDGTGACTYAHRQNMLNPSYVVMGIGYASSSTSSYGYYWTTDFGGYLDQTINLNAAPPPTIASFTAVPSAITAGQSATLTWSISGATSVSLNNGIGDVSNVTSKSVSPAQTTTYTLTATNSGGSSTATATVTVNPPPDTQPPSAPVLIGAVAKSATEVDLSWAASVDNVGVAGYQIIRNSSVLASVASTALAYADTSVAANSSYTYVVKAYDAAGNYSSVSNSIQVTTPVAATPPPSGPTVSIWPDSTTPAIGFELDGRPLELGVKFRSDVSGQINGIRFYKGRGITGTHTGSLWSSTGTLLATGTFTNETLTGWQVLLFSAPVAISANTIYVASYNTSTGGYAVNLQYFMTQGADNTPLHAPEYGVDGPNGVFVYSTGGQFPASDAIGNNFWVDVLFSSSGGSGGTVPPPPPTPQSVVLASGSGQSATVGTGFAVALQAQVLDGTSSPLSGITVTFTAPSSGASATFAGGASSATAVTNAQGIATAPAMTANSSAGTYSVTASVGSLAPASFTLTNTASSAPPPSNPPPSGASISIWPDSTTPAIGFELDGRPLELGVKFRSDVSGQINGIRFYKGRGITGTHTGSLWSSTGTLLATGTFTNETLTGWQVLLFSAPVAISANTIYVASYNTSTGGYAVNLQYFMTQGADNAPLHALEYGVDGPNGVFVYSTGGQFPASDAIGNNFWVDVLFQQ